MLVGTWIYYVGWPAKELFKLYQANAFLHSIK